MKGETSALCKNEMFNIEKQNAVVCLKATSDHKHLGRHRLRCAVIVFFYVEIKRAENRSTDWHSNPCTLCRHDAPMQRPPRAAYENIVAVSNCGLQTNTKALPRAMDCGPSFALQLPITIHMVLRSLFEYVRILAHTFELWFPVINTFLWFTAFVLGFQVVVSGFFLFRFHLHVRC